MKREKESAWIRPRHRVVQAIAAMCLYPYCRLKYGITIEKFKEQDDRNYLILMNHQTPFDQFFVGLAVRGPVYYVATEDIFSNGWVSDLIRWLVAPIPIKKQTKDVAAVRNCWRIAKAGGTIAIAPEGNRTYSGRTEYMNPAIAGLARVLGLPIALFRIEGGYGVQPRWSDVIRKGKMRGRVSRVIEPEEYKQMSEEDLLALIREGLDVNEAAADGHFYHRKRAEYLERAIYVCPFCGLSEFESKNEVIECKKCGIRVVYETTKELTGEGFAFPFRFAAEWYDYQKAFVNQLDVMDYTDQELYRDKVTLSEVILNKKKVRLREDAELKLYGDRIAADEGTEQEWIFSFEDISAASVLGRNKLNLYHCGRVYQVRGGSRFNALKYVNIYYRWKNSRKGDPDDQFLGL